MKSQLVLFSMVSFFSVFLIQTKPQIVQSDVFYVVAQGNKKAIKAWIKSKPDLSIRNASGQTLLHAAVFTGNRDVVKMFLKAGVSVNAQDVSGKTALDHAVESKDVKITYDLVKKKALIACVSNEKPLKDLIMKRMTRLYKIFGMIVAVGVALIAVGYIVMFSFFTGLDRLIMLVVAIIPGIELASIGILEMAGLGVTSAVRTRKDYLLQS